MRNTKEVQPSATPKISSKFIVSTMSMSTQTDEASIKLLPQNYIYILYIYVHICIYTWIERDKIGIPLVKTNYFPN